jgi:predicted nucleic acid-binding protein
LPLTENTGHRALIYIEEFALSSHMRAGDAVIAATAVENNLTLVSSNVKHFKAVKELQLRGFVAI